MRARPATTARPTTRFAAWSLAFAAAWVLALGGCAQRAPAPVAKDYDEPLPPGAEALREVDPALLPSVAMTASQRADLRRGIANSLEFFKKPQSERWFPISGVSRAQVVRSLKELDRLLGSGIGDQELAHEIKARFRVLESVGCDGRGTVLFTGYYTPLWPASLTQDTRYRYPIYRRPADSVMPPQGGDPNAGVAMRRHPDGTLSPYPTREEIVRGGLLAGQELVWLTDPFDAYCVEVQGNAKLRLEDGRLFEIGYNGTNNYPYHGIAEDLVSAGKISKQGLNFFTLRAYFRDHPQEVEADIERNPRMVFFREVHGGPYGQLSEPVIGDVTIATDKHIFPAGAPCMVETQIADPSGTRAGYVALRLDQDTGGGVRVAGHVDLYMGEGDPAERRAGSQYYEGKLFYLILREVAAAMAGIYRVKRIFGPTIQGEGLHAGLPCVFLRLAGCNAWDGRAQTRASSACPYCDTDFRGGSALEADAILAQLRAARGGRPGLGCVISGGEPLLQADEALIAGVAADHGWVDIETNGTRPVPARPANVSISCSPKLIPGQAVVAEPDWWKVLIPDQERFLARALASGKPVFLQPTCPDAGPAGAAYAANCARAVALCLEHGCRISLQLHKYLGLE